MEYFYYSLGALLERLEYVELSNKAYYEFYSDYRSLGFDVTRDDAFLVANDFFYNKEIYPIEIIWNYIDLLAARDKFILFEDRDILFEFTGLDVKDVVRADYFEI